ncbi:MAG TPA: hypothetical protein PKA98_11380 [Acidimicrobiales bacterium]|nr:hypothetical protein [Acidimicrobiales bacterium]
MATPDGEGHGRLRGVGRPAVLLGLVAALALVLLALPHLDPSPTAPAATGNVATAEDLDQCLAGGADGCTIPELRQCLQGDVAVSCDDIVVSEPSTTSSTTGDTVLVGLFVLAPFVLVLGPLGWRAARRTRRRNVAAFAADADAREAMGFVAASDPAPAVFALEQAWQRATRTLVREGPPPVWLFELERPMGLVFDRWPTRSAVFVPEMPLPSGALVPTRERGGASRFRGTFPRSPAGDAVVRAVGPLLDRRRGQVALVIGGGLVELRTVAAPGTEPLTLSALAEMALDVVDTIDAIGSLDALDAARAGADAPG